jgi:thioredoxin reductase
MKRVDPELFDVSIIGGGPAGLSAGITLGRACRRVVLFDNGHPRNAASQAVHCFLGSEGVSPSKLRQSGAAQAESYGVKLVNGKITAVLRNEQVGSKQFLVRYAAGEFSSRTVLFATGVRDVRPTIQGLNEFYGTSVHHCPYCDGWEHRDKRLAVIGKSPVELGLTLSNWSQKITVCTNGEPLKKKDAELLARNRIEYCTQPIHSLRGTSGKLECIQFEDGSTIDCDALFFSSDQQQRSNLPDRLGCEHDDKGHVKTDKSQCTNIEGVFLAGDADGEVQFAIAAAAEGAIAAVAIDEWLRVQDIKR